MLTCIDGWEDGSSLGCIEIEGTSEGWELGTDETLGDSLGWELGAMELLGAIDGNVDGYSDGMIETLGC